MSRRDGSIRSLYVNEYFASRIKQPQRNIVGMASHSIGTQFGRFENQQMLKQSVKIDAEYVTEL